MPSFALAFLLGVLLLQSFSYLPSENWLWVVILITPLVFFWRLLRLPIICAWGFIWALTYAHFQLSWELPSNWEGKTILVRGIISNIPDNTPENTSFLLSAKKIQYENKMKSARGQIRLNWRHPDTILKVGDEWQFQVHLKKIHGLMNPGGFDYEAFALQEGIRAHGYVIKSEANKRLSYHFYSHPIDRIRQFLQEKILKNLPETNTSPWIVALSIGERHGIKPENWEVLRNTGTNHLMAIAGLHIGLMSGFLASVTIWIWRCIPRFTLWLPAQHAGAIAALLMALIYSAMAGFSIPTQRACVMLSIFLVILLVRRKIVAWYAWSIALLFVLVLNPLTVLSESFWLSFAAVATIIYGVSGRLAPKGLWWKWGRIQWVIAVGLIPLSIGLFQQFSLISFLANSISIPWVGFLVVPLCLFGSFLVAFSDKAGGFILVLADKILNIMWNILTYLSQLKWASWYQIVPDYGIVLAACLGVILLLLPKGMPGRYLGIIWFLPLFFYHSRTPKLGEVWLTLLDIGQGLSAVVQTQNHFLVFDTGPKLSANYDMGESVLVPFLRSQQAKKIDLLIVSHGDNDHIGGSAALLKHFPVSAIKTSVPEKFPLNQASYCLRGQSWEWDHIHFEFLYPTQEKLHLGNNSSCVLRITNHNKSILLTGDIEKLAEQELINSIPDQLAANILIAPHHGSKTSAVEGFLRTVSPDYVLFPIGYRNRYHFPHNSVLQKYTDLGTKQINTASAGAIQFSIEKDALSIPKLYRVSHHHYWNCKVGI